MGQRTGHGSILKLKGGHSVFIRDRRPSQILTAMESADDSGFHFIASDTDAELVVDRRAVVAVIESGQPKRAESLREFVAAVGE